MAGGLEQLERHAEVVMLDFAASLLGELEAWMLQASPAMVDLATFPDISHAFNGPPSVVDDIQKRMYSDEVPLRCCVICSGYAHFYYFIRVSTCLGTTLV